MVPQVGQLLPSASHPQWVSTRHSTQVPVAVSQIEYPGWPQSASDVQAGDPAVAETMLHGPSRPVMFSARTR